MKIITDKEKIQNLLTKAVSEIIIRDHFKKNLFSGKKLRIKFGIDPTAPNIHLGHSVPLLKLRQFQELGHQAVLIIGDFTARIGDPSGRIEARKPLSESEIKKNLRNYLSQAGKIIDIKKTETHFNSEWFNKMTAREFLELTNKATVQQVTKRKDFRNRIKEDADITANEIMYPLLQGYDSVMAKADVEVGGEDQLLNLLMGRRIQRAYGMPEQDILTTWLIEGMDGIRKMSKSYGNYISITEKPDVMFGKVMSIPDALIVKYFKALTLVPDADTAEIEVKMKNGKLNPRDAKNRLSFEIVRIYHGEKKAKAAREEFERVFKRHELPENIQEIPITIKPRLIVELLMQIGLALSRSDARRKVLERNAVKVDGQVINDPSKVIDVYEGMIVQYGKRNFRKIVKK